MISLERVRHFQYGPVQWLARMGAWTGRVEYPDEVQRVDFILCLDQDRRERRRQHFYRPDGSHGKVIAAAGVHAINYREGELLDQPRPEPPALAHAAISALSVTGTLTDAYLDDHPDLTTDGQKDLILRSAIQLCAQSFNSLSRSESLAAVWLSGHVVRDRQAFADVLGVTAGTVSNRLSQAGVVARSWQPVEYSFSVLS